MARRWEAEAEQHGTAAEVEQRGSIRGGGGEGGGSTAAEHVRRRSTRLHTAAEHA